MSYSNDSCFVNKIGNSARQILQRWQSYRERSSKISSFLITASFSFLQIRGIWCAFIYIHYTVSLFFFLTNLHISLTILSRKKQQQRVDALRLAGRCFADEYQLGG